MENYKIVVKIGEGGFGEVLRAIDMRSGETVALKKIFVRRVEEGIPIGVWREAACLRRIDHANVVRLRECFAYGSSVVLSMECLDFSLADVIRAAKAPLGEARTKAYMQPLLRGLGYVHSLGLIHRDVKPGNILLTTGGAVKLADFGLARTCASNERGYSYQAATRWYRSPEMLYSAREYGTEVDTWSAGCIMVELFMLSPLFPGETDIDQLFRVLSVRGTPNLWIEDWPEVQGTPDFDKISFGDMPAVHLHSLIPNATAEAADLADVLLQVAPKRRASARDALSHSWFIIAPSPARLSGLQAPEVTGGKLSPPIYGTKKGAEIVAKALGL